MFAICSICGNIKEIKSSRASTAKYCSTKCQAMGKKKELEPCSQCGGENKRSKTGLCGNCYKREWYKNNKDKVFKQVYEYQRQNKDKRKEWVYRWKISRGLCPPRELKELLRAYKFLEKVLADAKRRQRISKTSIRSGSISTK